MVLQAVDLTILKGEFVSLIGPSGCGKSTVLKLISGLTSPSQGAIRVDGMTPKNARETVSYIFQDATLLPWRPVEQNVGLGLELEGVSTDPTAGKNRGAAQAGGTRARSQSLSARAFRRHEECVFPSPAPWPRVRSCC